MRNQCPVSNLQSAEASRSDLGKGGGSPPDQRCRVKSGTPCSVAGEERLVDHPKLELPARLPYGLPGQMSRSISKILRGIAATHSVEVEQVEKSRMVDDDLTGPERPVDQHLVVITER